MVIDTMLKKQREVSTAKPDSLWQVAMLVDVAGRLPMRPEPYSSQVPTYYGMVCVVPKDGGKASNRPPPAET